MADETIVNGVVSDGDDQTAENFYDFDRENDATKVLDLNRKMEALVQEKLKLVRENEESGQRIKNLMAEIAGVRNDEAKMKERLREMEIEIEQSESGKKAVEAIAARAAELETEVARLQHDLISAMSDGDEANAEVRELKKMLAEKGSSLEVIMRENQLMKEGMEREVEEAMKAKATSERKVCELEKRIEDMVERESEMKREKIRVEEEAKARIDEKERGICGLKEQMYELEAVVAKIVLELEKEKREKKEVEVSKNGVEVSLRVSEEKVKEMESKMVQLQKKAEEAEKVMFGLKEKTVEAVNGIANKTGSDDELKGLNWQWPVLAATGTIVVAGAVCYLQYGRRR